MLPDQTALIAKSLDGVGEPAALDAGVGIGDQPRNTLHSILSYSTRGNRFTEEECYYSVAGSPMCRGA